MKLLTTFFAALALTLGLGTSASAQSFDDTFKSTDWVAANKDKANVVLVDVRPADEYRQGHIPGAINIPLNDIRQASAALDPTKEYIVYCQTGRRSSAAAFLLSQRGLHAALLDGGMRARAGTMESVE